jgi:hypothetical protein
MLTALAADVLVAANQARGVKPDWRSGMARVST